MTPMLQLSGWIGMGITSFATSSASAYVYPPTSTYSHGWAAGTGACTPVASPAGTGCAQPASTESCMSVLTAWQLTAHHPAFEGVPCFPACQVSYSVPPWASCLSCTSEKRHEVPSFRGELVLLPPPPPQGPWCLHTSRAVQLLAL